MGGMYIVSRYNNYSLSGVCDVGVCDLYSVMFIVGLI